MKAKNQIESRYSIEYLDNDLSEGSSSKDWLLKLIILVSVLGLLALALASNGLYPFKKKESISPAVIQNSAVEPIKAQAIAVQETKEEVELRKLEGEKQDLLFATALAEKQNATNEVKLLSIKNKKQKELVTIQIAENAALTEKLNKLNSQLALEKTKNHQLNTQIITNKDKNSELSGLLKSALNKAPTESENITTAATSNPETLALAGNNPPATNTDTTIEKEQVILAKVETESEVIELSGLLESALNEVDNSTEDVVVETTQRIEKPVEKSTITNKNKEVNVPTSETPKSNNEDGNLSNLLEEAISNANSADKDYMTTLAGLNEGPSNNNNLVQTDTSTEKNSNTVSQSNSVSPANESKNSTELGNMLEEAITNATTVDKNYLTSLDQLSNDEEITTEKIADTTSKKVAIQKPLTSNTFDYTNAISPSTAAQIDAIMATMQSFKENPLIPIAHNKPDEKSLQVKLQKQIDQLLTTKDDQETQYNVALSEESQIRNNAVRSIIVKQGETLWSISKRAYGKGSSYKKIIKANPHILNDGKIFLKEGQTLRVPN